jgi:hypothetical protein
MPLNTDSGGGPDSKLTPLCGRSDEIGRKRTGLPHLGATWTIGKDQVNDLIYRKPGGTGVRHAISGARRYCSPWGKCAVRDDSNVAIGPDP